MNPGLSDWLTVVSMFSALVVFLITTGLYSSWWMSKQFHELRTLIYEAIHKTELTIVNKLEYHEKNDDNRFEQLRNEIWDIRLRNASKDKVMDNIINRQLSKNVKP